ITYRIKGKKKLYQKTLNCKISIKKNQKDSTASNVPSLSATPYVTLAPTDIPDIPEDTPVPTNTPVVLETQTLEEDSLNMELDSSSRLTLDMDAQWKFSKIGPSRQEILAAVIPECDDSHYETVSLPHTWNAEDGADGWKTTDADGNSYYRGNGVYRKKLTLDSDIWKQKRVYLSFEGANTVTKVYVNGKFVGCHEGGYSGFRFDITNYILWDQTNLIAVLVNNSRTTYIAPLDWEGDFTKFGGIYRDVSLVGVNDASIDVAINGSEGVLASTQLSDDYGHGTVDVCTHIRNEGKNEKPLRIISVLKDREGVEVARAGVSTVMKPNCYGDVKYPVAIAEPHLWNGVKDPYLYTMNTYLLSGEEVLETVTTEIGFRQYEVQNNQFYLNGQPYDIHGVNYHQDSFANGWAMTDEERDADYAMMLDMGVTAVRMAHYQHDPYEYQLCDRLGLIVYTEIPLINRSTNDNFTVDWTLFTNNIKQQLRELIYQNYNHPSICFWGISNELYDTDEETSKLYTELCNLATSLDSTRKTIYADNQAYAAYVERSEAADLVGYNRYDGWYYGNLGGTCAWVAEHQQDDSRPSCISEYGAGAAVSQHMDQPSKKDITPNGKKHCEEYQAIYHEEAWKDIVTSGNVWGEFIWCMFDFASDSREEGDTKGQNDKGLVTRDRQIKKDAYYFYKSVWSEEKMVHITSSRYQERPYKVPELKVYSTAETVEVFVNDQSVGVRSGSAEDGKSTIFTWNDVVLLQNQENTVKAVATFADGSQKEEWVTWTGIGE
nr:glycoside hydrolase family 2 protein [Lachnospiraceae bacterium]